MLRVNLLVAILGPTATGKSALALALAERYGGEIVNCDSTAVYRGFDIGTDKVRPAERRGIPHHLRSAWRTRDARGIFAGRGPRMCSPSVVTSVVTLRGGRCR